MEGLKQNWKQGMKKVTLADNNRGENTTQKKKENPWAVWGSQKGNKAANPYQTTGGRYVEGKRASVPPERVP